jgi:hypothetical protein
MSTHTSVDSKPSDVFKTFPEFSKLTLADRKKYEPFVRDLPPMSGYSFPTLMNWWNTLNSCAVSTLNDNLIVSYWMPGLEKVSGVSFIGTKEVDESVCFIFDHLKAQGERPRLVHVPEFVIEHMQHPELFQFKPERASDEYVIALSKFFPINKTVSYRRYRVRKFLSKVEDKEVLVGAIDLALKENREQLLTCVKEWPSKGTINYIVDHLRDALMVSIRDAELIGTEALGLYVDGELQAFMLYTQVADKRYVIFSHVMVKHEITYTYDYLLYAFSKWLTDRGFLYVNIDEDLGIPVLRMLKVALGPVNYFRKYTIEPAK